MALGMWLTEGVDELLAAGASEVRRVFGALDISPAHFRSWLDERLSDLPDGHASCTLEAAGALEVCRRKASALRLQSGGSAVVASLLLDRGIPLFKEWAAIARGTWRFSPSRLDDILATVDRMTVAALHSPCDRDGDRAQLGSWGDDRLLFSHVDARLLIPRSHRLGEKILSRADQLRRDVDLPAITSTCLLRATLTFGADAAVQRLLLGAGIGPMALGYPGELRGEEPGEIKVWLSSGEGFTLSETASRVLVTATQLGEPETVPLSAQRLLLASLMTPEARLTTLLRASLGMDVNLPLLFLRVVNPLGLSVRELTAALRAGDRDGHGTSDPLTDTAPEAAPEVRMRTSALQPVLQSPEIDARLVSVPDVLTDQQPVLRAAEEEDWQQTACAIAKAARLALRLHRAQVPSEIPRLGTSTAFVEFDVAQAELPALFAATIENSAVIAWRTLNGEWHGVRTALTQNDVATLHDAQATEDAEQQRRSSELIERLALDAFVAALRTVPADVTPQTVHLVAGPGARELPLAPALSTALGHDRLVLTHLAGGPVSHGIEAAARQRFGIGSETVIDCTEAVQARSERMLAFMAAGTGCRQLRVSGELRDTRPAFGATAPAVGLADGSHWLLADLVSCSRAPLVVLGLEHGDPPSTPESAAFSALGGGALYVIAPHRSLALTERAEAVEAFYERWTATGGDVLNALAGEALCAYTL
jgi:hypothetical protein